jgi:hypothetical protein
VTALAHATSNRPIRNPFEPNHTPVLQQLSLRETGGSAATSHWQDTGPLGQRKLGLLLLSLTPEPRRLTGKSFVSDDFGSKSQEERRTFRFSDLRRCLTVCSKFVSLPYDNIDDMRCKGLCVVPSPEQQEKEVGEGGPVSEVQQRTMH